MDKKPNLGDLRIVAPVQHNSDPILHSGYMGMNKTSGRTLQVYLHDGVPKQAGGEPWMSIKLDDKAVEELMIALAYYRQTRVEEGNWQA